VHFPSRILTITALTLLATNVALADDLNVATYGGAWMDAAKAAYWAPFQQQTGIKIIGDVTDDSLGAIRALAANTPAKWDVMEADMLEATEACNEGLVHPIDKSLLPAADFIPSSIQECGVASAAIGVVMVVNKDKFGGSGPKTWQDFWDVKRFPGKRAMSRYVQSVAVIALLADGVPPAQVSTELRKPGARERVFKKLAEIKDDLVFITTGTEFIQGLVSGSYDMAVGWNARVNTANKETGDKFEIIWSAGYNLGMNAYLIPKTAAHPEAAMKYIAFVSNPAYQAKFMEMFPYGGPNKKAYELLSVQERDLQPADPAHLPFAVPDDYEFWAGRYDEWQQALEAWIAAK
jgi:putative spermidine/putrescine transport system substrate-binding protein